jgi:hypothetical protein
VSYDLHLMKRDDIGDDPAAAYARAGRRRRKAEQRELTPEEEQELRCAPPSSREELTDVQGQLYLSQGKLVQGKQTSHVRDGPGEGLRTALALGTA